MLSASSSDITAQVMAVPAVSMPRVNTFKAGAKPPALKTIPTLGGGKNVPTTVSLEDYEDVKKMWLSHYKSAPVPVSENIKERKQWISEDIKKLNNTINLLSSSNPTLRQKGLEQVSELLPFLLLGGFSEVETLTYLRAKMEAAKQAMAESEAAEAAKKESQKSKEEEETLLPVEAKKKEEEKAGHIEEMMEMEEKKNETMHNDSMKQNDSAGKADNLPKEEGKG